MTDLNNQPSEGGEVLYIHILVDKGNQLYAHQEVFYERARAEEALENINHNQYSFTSRHTFSTGTAEQINMLRERAGRGLCR